jgi:hypothetical protein
MNFVTFLILWVISPPAVHQTSGLRPAAVGCFGENGRAFGDIVPRPRSTGSTRPSTATVFCSMAVKRVWIHAHPDVTICSFRLATLRG